MFYYLSLLQQPGEHLQEKVFQLKVQEGMILPQEKDQEEMSLHQEKVQEELSDFGSCLGSSSSSSDLEAETSGAGKFQTVSKNKSGKKRKNRSPPIKEYFLKKSNIALSPQQLY